MITNFDKTSHESTEKIQRLTEESAKHQADKSELEKSKMAQISALEDQITNLNNQVKLFNEQIAQLTGQISEKDK